MLGTLTALFPPGFESLGVAGLVGASYLGALSGRALLNAQGDICFGRALNILFTLIALRLIWSGVSTALAL